jgi:hypothetical protein
MVPRPPPERSRKFLADSEEAARRRYIVYQQLAGISVPAAAPAEGVKDGSEPAPKEDA